MAPLKGTSAITPGALKRRVRSGYLPKKQSAKSGLSSTIVTEAAPRAAKIIPLQLVWLSDDSDLRYEETWPNLYLSGNPLAVSSKLTQLFSL